MRESAPESASPLPVTGVIKGIRRQLSAILTYCLTFGPHITRYSMHRALKDILADESRGAGKKALTIGLSANLLPVLGIDNASVTEANYPEHNIINLSAFTDASFDFVISDQVLEHVEGNPQLAFDTSMRVLKPGGIAVHPTCFINPIHGHPGDFWRFNNRQMVVHRPASLFGIPGFDRFQNPTMGG